MSPFLLGFPVGASSVPDHDLIAPTGIHRSPNVRRRNLFLAEVDRAIASPIVQIVRASPLSGLATSSAEERATRARDALTKRASAETSNLEDSIRTIR